MNFAKVSCKETPADGQFKGNLSSPFPNHEMNGLWHVGRTDICMSALCVLEKHTSLELGIYISIFVTLIALRFAFKWKKSKIPKKERKKKRKKMLGQKQHRAESVWETCGTTDS